MAKLGFMGLGLMGYPMARNLRRAGHEVAVWSHKEAKAKKLASDEGAVFCSTPREVGAFAECMFACVGNSAMSEEVFTGPNGVIAGVKAGAVCVDASTIGPSTSRRIGKKLGEKGAHYLDAPCTGSTPRAEDGGLTFMIGGPPDVYERVKEFFQPMGKNFYYCGGPGMGLHAKLSQNLVLASIMQGFIEGMVLATKAGVDPELMFKILDNSAAKAGLISYKAPFIFRREFNANFSLKWMHKDLGLILESAQELSVPIPAAAVVHEMFGASVAKGHGDEDFCSAVTLLEDWAGVTVEARKNT